MSILGAFWDAIPGPFQGMFGGALILWALLIVGIVRDRRRVARQRARHCHNRSHGSGWTS